MHLRNPPLDDVAEAFVVDIKVLSAHRALGPLFKFVLPMAGANGFSLSNRGDPGGRERRRTPVLAHLFPELP